MNERANKSMITKDKNEKWPIRPTRHQKILFPIIKYKVSENRTQQMKIIIIIYRYVQRERNIINVMKYESVKKINKNNGASIPYVTETKPAWVVV